MTSPKLNPKEFTFRSATHADLNAMAEVYNISVTDMFKRHGVIRSPRPTSYTLASYDHVINTGHFFLAENRDQIAAICGAIVRGKTWFLSGFWTLPELQGRGLGAPLLNMAIEWGKSQEADTFFVWSSIDAPALAMYMKAGMLPGTPVYFFDTPRDFHWLAPAVDHLDCIPLQADVAGQIDASLRGSPREEDHIYFTNVVGMQGWQVMDGTRVAGYFYVGSGALAPVGWMDSRDAEGVLACGLAHVDRTTPTRVYVPGYNHAALTFLLRSGLHITSHAHLLLSKPFGKLDQYLPSGPGVY